MKFLRIFFTLLLALCATALTAQQQTEKKPSDQKPATEANMGMMPTPSPEIVKLSKMVLGTWTTHESHDANDMMPAGTSTGTSSFSHGPGEFSIVENFSSTGAMGPFKGMGVYWWDPKQQAYKVTWCDTMMPSCDSGSTAKWEGEKLVEQGEMEMPDGNKMYTRSEYTDITPNSFTLTMYGGANASSVKKFMTIKYTRGSSSETKPTK